MGKANAFMNGMLLDHSQYPKQIEITMRVSPKLQCDNHGNKRSNAKYPHKNKRLTTKENAAAGSTNRIERSQTGNVRKLYEPFLKTM